jgi:hypothetical protein
MRQELKEYKLHYEEMPESRPVMHLNEVITRARNSAREQLSE